MRKSIVATLAALSFGALANPATAEETAPVETTVVTVSYADLDLAKPADSLRLQARIERAVDIVCARPDLRDLKSSQVFEDCAGKSREGAMEQLNLSRPIAALALAGDR